MFAQGGQQRQQRQAQNGEIIAGDGFEQPDRRPFQAIAADRGQDASPSRSRTSSRSASGNRAWSARRSRCRTTAAASSRTRATAACRRWVRPRADRAGRGGSIDRPACAKARSPSARVWSAPITSGARMQPGHRSGLLAGQRGRRDVAAIGALVHGRRLRAPVRRLAAGLRKTQAGLGKQGFAGGAGRSKDQHGLRFSTLSSPAQAEAVTMTHRFERSRQTCPDLANKYVNSLAAVELKQGYG